MSNKKEFSQDFALIEAMVGDDAFNNSCCGCGPDVSPEPKPSPSVTRSASATPTPTVSSEVTPTPTRTPDRTPSPTLSATATPYPSKTPASTQAPLASATPTPTAVNNVTPSPSVTRTPRSTVTPTPSTSNTPWPSKTPSSTKAPLGTATPTPTTTLTATPNPTMTRTPRSSTTPTPTNTSTPWPSKTPAATKAPTGDVTPTPTRSTTPTPTGTSRVTPTATGSATVTPTKTAGVSPTPTSTVTPTVTKTPVVNASPTPTSSPNVGVSPTPSSTVTPTPTQGSLVSPTPSPTSSVTPTATAGVAVSQTPTPTTTVSPSPGNVSPTPTSSVTATPNAGVSPTPTSTVTPTPTQGSLVSPTPSPTSSATPTATAGVAVSQTPTPTTTVTPSPGNVSPTPSPTSNVGVSVTPTTTPTTTPNAQVSPTPTTTASATPSPTAVVQASQTPTPTITATVTPTISVTPSPEAVLPFIASDWTLSFDTANSPVRSLIDINMWNGNAAHTPDQIMYQTVVDGNLGVWTVYTDFAANPDLKWPRHLALMGGGLAPGVDYRIRIKAVVNGRDSVYDEKGGIVPPVVSPTPTPTITPSLTAEVTPTSSVTPTVTPSVTSSVSGTPPVTATITPSVTPTNSVTPTVTPTISVTPTPSNVPEVEILSDSFVGNNPVQGSDYSSQLTANGGTGEYIFSVVGTPLAEGLTLDSTTGIVSGTAPASGQYTYTFRVDSGPVFDQKEVSIYVYSEPLDMWFNGATEITTDTSIEIVFEGQGGWGEPYKFLAPTVNPQTYPELVYDSQIQYIYGYIRIPGVYTIPVTVRDSVDGIAHRDLVITVTNAPEPSPTPSPSLSSLPEDSSLYYVNSEITDNVPSSAEARSSGVVNGFISDKKLMIRNSYFTMSPDSNGYMRENTSKVITLDESDNPDVYTVALYTPNGYDMEQIAYVYGDASDNFVNSNLSFLPHTNQLIMTRSDVSTNTFLLDIWDMSGTGKLDWSSASPGATIPPPTRTHTFTPTLAGNIIGPIHRVYVDRASDENGNGHDRIYMLTKNTSTSVGDVLVATAINKRNQDGSTTLVESTTNYVSTSAGETIGSTSQPPNPNFTVIFTIEKNGKTEKIIASRFETLFDVPMLVSDVSGSNLPKLNHVTTSADYKSMLASSLLDNIIYSFDQYTLNYIDVYGSVDDATPTTVVNYDYIRMNLIPTNSHNVWDASLTSPWAKVNVINYDDYSMDMTYLHYDIHRSILRVQSWKYAQGSDTEVVGTYIGYIGIKSVIPALPTPTPTATPLASPTQTPTSTPAVTPTLTPSATATVTPTVSVTSSVTPTQTPSGTPAVTPTVTMTVTPSVTQSLTPSITVTPSMQASVTPSPSPIPELVIDVSNVPINAMKGIPYEGKVTSVGGPNPIHIYSVDSVKKLPNGLSINSGTGEVTGIPIEEGTFSVVFKAESSPYISTEEIIITVHPFDVTYDGMSYTTVPEDFKNLLDGTVMPNSPTETYDAGSF